MPMVISTIDTPEQVQAALAKAGLQAESVQSDAAETPAPEKKPEETPAPGEPPAQEAGHGEPGTTADASGASGEDQEHEDEPVPDEAVPDEPGKPKPRGGFQKKIDRLTRELREKEAEAEGLKRQLAEKPAEKPPEKPPEKPAEPPDAAAAKPPDATTRPKPTLPEFETYEDWVEAVADWKAEQKLATANKEIADLRAELKARDDAAKAAEARQPAIDAWVEKVQQAEKLYPDFREVTEGPEAEQLQLTAVMHGAIFESDRGPEIVYHLAKNPDECRRIAGLSPLSAVREIGRIEATLPAAKPTPDAAPPAKAPEKKPPQPSSAPPPIRPVAGATAAKLKAPRDGMTLAEYAAWVQTPEGQAWRKGQR